MKSPQPSPLNPQDFKRAFMNSLDNLGGLDSLFENLPNLSFWVKDTRGRFIAANQNVVSMCGRQEEEHIIGRTDFDFFPKHTAEDFRRDDLSVIQNGARIVDRIEPISLKDGSVRWYSTNKVPLYGRGGKIIGVAGTTREMNMGQNPDPIYAEFSSVIEYINRCYPRLIEVTTLARMMSLSVSQFERRFKQAFKETPVHFILKIRINEACKLLVGTRQSIAWISGATGFFDPSYFSKQFSRKMGMSPKRYREAYYQGAA
jgi:PAS domain S-box-containing protein